MATWKAWERDSDKRGKDAAANWREAFELTMECWRMACLEDLKKDVSDILVLLANRKDCCDDNVTYNIQIQIGTEIDPGIGDPPEFYGETAVSDWDDWLEHVCYNANLYVDNLINMASQMEGAVAQSSIYIGLIAAALAVLSFSGIGLPIAYLLAAGVVAGLILTATTSTFDTTAEDFEDARESIVCALLLGYDLASAVEGALSSGAAWDLFYQFADYSSATAAIYEGGYNQDYLPSETRDDCEVCAKVLVDDSEVWTDVVFGTFISFNDETKEWTYQAETASNCDHVNLRFWEDDTKTTKVHVHIVVTSCNGSIECPDTGYDVNWGIDNVVTVWKFNTPHLVDISYHEIDQFVHVHDDVSPNYFITFKLYHS
jgi:hypothetical protein